MYTDKRTSRRLAWYGAFVPEAAELTGHNPLNPSAFSAGRDLGKAREQHPRRCYLREAKVHYGDMGFECRRSCNRV
jgi:hypothetical protein